MTGGPMIAVFWLAALALVHVYGGYGLLLRAVARLRPLRRTGDTAQPTVSILLTVRNEQEHIIPRLENLLAQVYPHDRMEIMVASDGSDDETEARTLAFAAAHPDRSIRLDVCRQGRGKSAAQNQAVPLLSGDIVVLTDAATRFDPHYLARIAAPFGDRKVGCVTGQVVFSPQAGAVSAGQQRYWRSEMALRERESHLGILAVASGQAMAFRRQLFRPLPLHVGDDCIIPLDVVAAGARVIHQPDAIAYDETETRTRGEVRARVRMTARNWVGTWHHPLLLSPIHHPGYALALWSHKLLRWLSPVLLLLLGMSALALSEHPFYGACAAIGMAGAALAGWGYYADKRGGRAFPPARLAFAFAVAQWGFLWGLWTVIRGRRIRRYTP